MSCFIHRKKEGVAVCKQCGKNMCEDCSSLVSHSGLCPTCYRPHIVEKIINAEQEKKDEAFTLFKKIALSILLCWTILYPLLQIPYYFSYRKIQNNLSNEIEKNQKILYAIDKAINQGSKEKI